MPGLLKAVLQTFALYVFLIAGFRLLGRRQVSELSPVELLVVAVIGSSVETAMVGGDRSLQAGLIAASTLFLANRGLAALARRSPRFKRLLLGKPVMLIHNGHLLEDNMRRAGLTVSDVEESLHEHGFESADQIKVAILEVDGRVSAIPREGQGGEEGGGAEKRPV